MEAYLSFKSADGTTISDSIYLGNINGTWEEIEKEEKTKKYMELKASFDEVEKRYLEKQALFLKSLIKRKSFNHIEREYKELKDKFENLPGKPV